jgi:antitoxin StbD
MQALRAASSIGITDLKKNPSAVIREAGDSPVVVLHHNKPSAYLVPAKTYEAMMDLLDDIKLAAVVQQRVSQYEADPSTGIEVTLAQLAREAKPSVLKKPKK